jgi:small subunit ribosomal protein S16
MVVIRLARSGAKKKPFYHFVATDKRNRRDGRHIEQLGFFNPYAKGQAARLGLDIARVDYWLDKGAQLSERAGHLVTEFKSGPESRESHLDKKKAKDDSKKQAKAAAAAAASSSAE